MPLRFDLCRGGLVVRLGVQAGEGREQVSGGDDGNRHPLQRGKGRGDGEAGKDREARAQDQRLLVLQQIQLVGVQGERDGEDRQRPERAGEEREAEPGQESPNSRSPRVLAIEQIVMAKPYS